MPGRAKSLRVSPRPPKPRHLSSQESQGARQESQGASIAGEAGIQALIDAFPFNVIVVDESHRIVLSNDKCCSFTGKPTQSICGTLCPKTMHGLDGPFPGCPLEEAVKSGKGTTKELHDPATGRWMKTGVFPFTVPGSDGRRLYLHFAEDVTELKSIEIRDRRKSDMLRVSSDLMAASHSAMSTDALLGRALDLLLSMSWLSVEARGAIFLVDEERDTLRLRASRGLREEAVARCSQVPFGRCLCGLAAQQRITQHASCMDERHESKSVHLSDHGHYCVPIRSPDRLWGVFNLYLKAGHSRVQEEVDFLEDVGATLAMVLAHRSAEQTQSRLSTILDATSDFVGVADLQARTLWMNAGGRTMAGLPPDEDVRGVPIDAFHPRAALKTIRELGIPAAIAKGVWEGETAILRRDGKQTPVSQLILAHRGPSGEVEFLSTIARDLSGRKELESQLRQAQKLDAVGQLAAGVAHDFNNLLSIIMLSSNLLVETLPVDSPNRLDADEILRACKRGSDLTGQLLAFSREQRGDTRVIEVDGAVRNVARMLTRLIGEHILLDLRLNASGLCTRIDPSQLEQVLTNLSINARDAMAQGGTLGIATRCRELDDGQVKSLRGIDPGVYVELEVSDTGSGMTQEILERVFEPFFTTKPTGKGTGLGLSMAYGVVTQHGGHIAIDSEPGKGTKVRILLRLAEPESEQTMPQPSIRAPATVPTVLLVEDDEGVRRVTSRMLSSAGYRVIEAFDGEDGLRQFAAHAGKVAAVVTDLVMPAMGGEEMARRMAEIDPGVRVIFTSGYPNRSELLPDGPRFEHVVLSKPFDRRSMLAALKKVFS